MAVSLFIFICSLSLPCRTLSPVRHPSAVPPTVSSLILSILVSAVEKLHIFISVSLSPLPQSFLSFVPAKVNSPRGKRTKPAARSRATAEDHVSGGLGRQTVAAAANSNHLTSVMLLSSEGPGGGRSERWDQPSSVSSGKIAGMRIKR